MAIPPFNPSETTPADNSLVSAFPGAERTFRDIIESWLLMEHGRTGHHTLPSLSTVDRDAITDWEVGGLIYNTTLSKMQFVVSIGPVVWVDVIEFTETDVTAVAGTTSVAGIYEKATDAEVYAATANKVLTADLIETSAVPVTLTDQGTMALDWDAGLVRTWTMAANRLLTNPTNGQPGTMRKIIVKGNDGTDRTLTFDTQFLGGTPTLTLIDSATWYMLYIECIATDHFSVSSHRIK